MRCRTKLAAFAGSCLFLGAIEAAQGGVIKDPFAEDFEPRTCSYECWARGYAIKVYEREDGGGWDLVVEPTDAKEYADGNRRAQIFAMYGLAAQSTLVKTDITTEDWYCDSQGRLISRGPIYLVSYPSPNQIQPATESVGNSVGICFTPDHLVSFYNWGKPTHRRVPDCPIRGGACISVKAPEPDPIEPSIGDDFLKKFQVHLDDHWNAEEARKRAEETRKWSQTGEPPELDSTRDNGQEGGIVARSIVQRPRALEEDKTEVDRLMETQTDEKIPVRSGGMVATEAPLPFCPSGRTAQAGPLHYAETTSCEVARSEASSSKNNKMFVDACVSKFGGQTPPSVQSVRIDWCRTGEDEGSFEGVIVEVTACCS